MQATTMREGQSAQDPAVIPVVDDVIAIPTIMVNLYMVGRPGSDDWVLVDTGLGMFEQRILRIAQKRFGPDTRPRCIVLTHGHFDHVGNVVKLARDWNVPVYAHPLELPYLNGQRDYPSPDPSVGGGLLAASAFLYPRSGIDLGDRLHPLPPDGSVPDLPDWRWIHTPGHTDGHISLFREGDRVCLAGDAFITTKQESLLAVLTQTKTLHGPPAYFTTDWDAARESVRVLAALDPQVAATGHGLPMFGAKLAEGLAQLAERFEEIAIPPRGRYVHGRGGGGPRGVDEDAVPLLKYGPAVLIGAAALALLAGARGRRSRA